MNNVLVRGLSPHVYQRIQSMAKEENLSMNQMFLRLIASSVEKSEAEKEKDERQKEAFRRIREIREEIYQKYGLQDDSTKIIRKFRDSRNQ